MKQTGEAFAKGRVLTFVIIGFALGTLVLISRYNYPLFHTLAELISIVIAWSLFILAWNTRRYTSDDTLVLMGIGIFLTSLIDLVHTLAYSGLNLFPGYTADLPTQSWIAARYVQSLSLLAVSMRMQRPSYPLQRLTAPVALAAGALLVAVLLAAIFSGIFPSCYIEGTGLTPFKQGSEIVISLFLLLAILFFLRVRERFDVQVLQLLIGAIVLMIGSELLFTFYFSFHGVSNFIGHVSKIASFILLYLAIVHTGLKKPYALIFREMKRTEEELRENERRFRKIFEEGMYGIIIADSEGHYLSANAAFCRMVGYTSEELSSLKVADITHPDHIAQDAETFSKLREGRIHSRRMEKRYLTKSGDSIWADVTVSCIRDEQGKVLYFLNMIQDITERREKDVALRESEALYRTALESSNDAACILHKGRYLYANQKFLDTFGITLDELRQLPHGTLTHPDDRERIQDYHRKNMQGEPAPTRVEFRGLKKDGTPIYFEASVSLISYQGEKAQLSFLRDITARKLAELALKQSEERYRTMVESIADSYFELDLRGRYTFVNDALCRQLGYSRDEVMSLDYRTVTSPEDSKKLAQLYNEIYRTDTPKMTTYQIKNKQGEPRDREVYVSLMRDATGNPVGFRGIGRDVTERKRMEDERKKLTERLHQSQKMEAIGTLAGGIAHDFNNILATIMGYTELIKIKLKGRDLEEYLDQLLKACIRARDLINQILTFSRQKDKEVKPLNLEPVLSETMKLLRATIPSTIAIGVHIDPRPYPVMADSTEIYQIIMNLCTNAAYAMRDKGGTLEISLQNIEIVQPEGETADLQPGRYIELKVSDTGVGMEQEIIERIFDPFFTTKERGKGTGLGLSVVYGIVKQYGGAILVRSKPGLGSVFRIYLPALEIETAAPERKEMEMPHGSGRILFVDDEEALVEIARQMMEYLGYEVVTASNGTQALEIFRREPGRYNLVITDMTMPGMTGLNLAREILRLRPDLPVLICTGYSETLTEEIAQQSGIREILTKPLSMDKLARVLKKMLGPKTDQGKESTAVS